MTLVESDPLREVRIQACQALEAMLTDSTAYLAIAQDRYVSLADRFNWQILTFARAVRPRLPLLPSRPKSERS